MPVVDNARDFDKILAALLDHFRGFRSPQPAARSDSDRFLCKSTRPDFCFIGRLQGEMKSFRLGGNAGLRVRKSSSLYDAAG